MIIENPFSPEKQAIVTSEVLHNKTQEKKLQLEESLKIMFQENVIGKNEYHKKLESIEKNSQVIYDCLATNGNMNLIEAKLGIVSESLREVTFMGD